MNEVNDASLSLAAEISKARRRSGLSNAAFAKKLGVEASTVWRWETGRTKPKQYHINKIINTVAEPQMKASVAPAESVATPGAGSYEERFYKDAAVEAALLVSIGQITAAWIGSHRHRVNTGDIMEFIRTTALALRKENRA